MDNIEFGSAEESARGYTEEGAIDFSAFVVTRIKRIFLTRWARPHLARVGAGKRAKARMYYGVLGGRLKLPAGGSNE